MFARNAFLFCALIFPIFSISCSGNGSGNENPVAPAPEINASTVTVSPGSHYLWAYYQVYIDPSGPEIEVVPVRQTANHYNILGFLEQSPCSDCISIANVQIGSGGNLLIDVKIMHPFGSADYTAFDVRGIVMFNGSHHFPGTDMTVSNRASGEGELINADGFTALYNPSTAGHGKEGYIEGKVSTDQPPNCNLNPYMEYITDDPSNTRNAYYAGHTLIMTMVIDMPDGPFQLGYAVDANWAQPINSPVTDPMVDFPPGANCPEAWKILVSETPIGDGITDLGGQVELTIDVYDHQGPDHENLPIIECTELFDGTLEAELDEEFPGFYRYKVTVENQKLAQAGFYKCLIKKEAFENDPLKPWMDISA